MTDPFTSEGRRRRQTLHRHRRPAQGAQLRAAPGPLHRGAAARVRPTVAALRHRLRRRAARLRRAVRTQGEAHPRNRLRQRRGVAAFGATRSGTRPSASSARARRRPAAERARPRTMRRTHASTTTMRWKCWNARSPTRRSTRSASTSPILAQETPPQAATGEPGVRRIARPQARARRPLAPRHRLAGLCRTDVGRAGRHARPLQPRRAARPRAAPDWRPCRPISSRAASARPWRPGLLYDKSGPGSWNLRLARHAGETTRHASPDAHDAGQCDRKSNPPPRSRSPVPGP